MFAAVLLAGALILEPPPTAAGPWRAVLDLAGGTLRFALQIGPQPRGHGGRLCNGTVCQPVEVRTRGNNVAIDIPDYDATIEAELRGDSLVGTYRNMGNRGPRTIPFRAARGLWPSTPAPADLRGRWDATYFQDWGTSPRVFEFRNGAAGFEGTAPPASPRPPRDPGSPSPSCGCAARAAARCGSRRCPDNRT